MLCICAAAAAETPPAAAALWQPACLLSVFKLHQLNCGDTLTGFPVIIRLQTRFLPSSFLVTTLSIYYGMFLVKDACVWVCVFGVCTRVFGFVPAVVTLSQTVGVKMEETSACSSGSVCQTHT